MRSNGERLTGAHAPAGRQPRRSAPTQPSLEDLLLTSGAPGVFAPVELTGLPEPVARYFGASIAPGTPLARAARLRIRGHIRIGRWLPFTSTEVLDPHRGFVWRARVAGRLIVGFDRYVDRTAEMQWKLLGLLRIVHAEGPDLARSAAARAGGEGMWLPTAMLPRYGVTWDADGDDAVTARFAVDDTPMEVRYTLDRDGRVRSGVFDRWGDPDRSGTWGWHRCGGDVTAYGSFAGLTIPTGRTARLALRHRPLAAGGVLPLPGHPDRHPGRMSSRPASAAAVARRCS